MKKLLLFFPIALAAFPLLHAADAVKIELTGNDQMQFSAKAFEVTEGQVITLSFKHIGSLPATSMGHNVVILKPGTAVAGFAAHCVGAKDTDYVPTDEQTKAAVVSHTKIIGGGESTEITFTAGAPGEYPFLCSFPGHFGIMSGIMSVKAK